MSEQEQETLAHRFFGDAFSDGRLDVVDEIFAPDYRGYSSASLTGTIIGPDGIKQFISTYRDAFPDIQFTFEDVFTHENKVIARFRARGTHENTFAGIAATGRQLDVTGIGIADIVDGQIRVSRSEVNMLGMLQQLGFVPELKA